MNFRRTIVLCLLLMGCRDEIKSNPVTNFDVNKYLGTWFEIVRTDNRFERGCRNVTAQYSLRHDGGIDVVNSCVTKGGNKVAHGRAYFKENANVGALKVTFFWPFYGNYNVVYISDDYQHALVDGGSKKYLWVLSREKSMKTEDLDMLIKKAEQNGFDVSHLVYTTQG